MIFSSLVVYLKRGWNAPGKTFITAIYNPFTEREKWFSPSYLFLCWMSLRLKLLNSLVVLQVCGNTLRPDVSPSLVPEESHAHSFPSLKILNGLNVRIEDARRNEWIWLVTSFKFNWRIKIQQTTWIRSFLSYGFPFNGWILIKFSLLVHQPVSQSIRLVSTCHGPF